jgi:uncharacterized protein YbaP (TraB family)
MKLIITLLLFVMSVFTANSQPTKKSEKKYQGLLWEITGKGLARPSYLFGTMHVSNKLAFHLSDSFYYAIKSADVVALETNPANWQDDYSKSSVFTNSGSNMQDAMYNMFDLPNDYLRKHSFALKKYDNAIKLALATEPALINGLLYRTYNGGADFEEDTYLDLYIFQTGSRLGKRMAGVENFEESEKLVVEAYKDAAKEKRSKDYDSDYDYNDYIKSPYTLEDAYRRGDLDLLDSLELKQFRSKAFLEKFLYKRNEIQAKHIDSIIKTKASLFVGVGSAHLPGKRGVIEMLRSMGYTLRAVKMGQRDGQQKDIIDKVRVPVTFNAITADDGMYTVEMPGNKFYSFSKLAELNTKQYADMGNGAYYVVSRVKTNGLLQGEDENAVYKKIDSLLYENIPGKILKKQSILKNGYRGFDVTNRTRRGDVQRYNIIVTPFEILVFKISGIGDYVTEGGEANRFFSSINITIPQQDSWVNFMPATGGFKIAMPHKPVLLKDGISDRLEYTAFDKKENCTYSLFKANIHNYGFIEEDSFDLNLMEESYASGNVIDKLVWRQPGKWQGYPTLECKYKHKDGSNSMVRYLLQGPNYFAQVAHYATETKNVKQYFDSFRIVPFIYPQVQLRTDTAMKFTVKSPLYPDAKKENDFMETMQEMMRGYGDYADVYAETMPKVKFKNIGSDTLGERIFVAYMRFPKNGTTKDSVELFDSKAFAMGESGLQSFKYIKNDSGVTISGMRYRTVQVTDTGSSRTMIAKTFYKSGHFFSVITLTDTLTPQSSLLQNFISTFTPADTLTGESPFKKNNAQFFADFASKDSATHAKALKQLKGIEFDSTDLPKLKKIIDTLSWKTKDYLELKRDFIIKLSNIKDSTLPDYARQLYVAAKDTADLQNTILRTLLSMRTQKSFTAFKDLIISEPPVVTNGNGYDYSTSVTAAAGSLARLYNRKNVDYNGYNGDWYQLHDTLQLARTVFPDILQLINLDDYKGNVMELLTKMVDSGYVDAKMYEQYFTKFYTEAKQELKRERASESQKAIAKAEKANKADDEVAAYASADNDQDNGNLLLQSYAVLLMPYWDKNPGVATYFNDLMKLDNKRIRFNTMLLLLRNKKTVSDSLLNVFAAENEYRVSLYKQLKKLKMLDRLQEKYTTQQALTTSALYNANYYSRYDTLALLDKLPVTYKDKKGWVYFFKAKINKEEKKWRIVSFGMQPENIKEFDDENDDFSSAYGGYSYGRDDADKLDETKPVKEQLQKLLKIMLYKKHLSASRFYDEVDDEYKDIITERIKTNRFGD